MDTLITVIIVGMATGYILEFIGSFLKSDRWLKLVLTLPLSSTLVWITGVSGLMIGVVGLASAFFALSILHLLNKSVTINTITRR
jgi:uncharacterized membrane protein